MNECRYCASTTHGRICMPMVSLAVYAFVVGFVASYLIRGLIQ